MEIALRPATLEDKAFVYSTWLRGQYFGNDFYRNIEKPVYFDKYEKVLDHVLAKATVLVACMADDSDIILGYAVLEPGLLHWCYVKEPWRSKGIMNKLLAGSEISSVTHLTKAGNAIRLKKQWKFNPFLI